MLRAWKRRAHALLAHAIGAVAQRFERVVTIPSGPAKGLKFYGGREPELLLSGYEVPVQEAIERVVGCGAICYDVGASIGFFSILMSKVAGPTGHVYAFEPVPTNTGIIERNAALNRIDNIYVARVALSCRTGSTELLLARHIGGAMLADVGIPSDYTRTISVQIDTIDNLIESGRVQPPDIVKIDVEGAELDILRGMERTLREIRPVLIMEFDDQQLEICELKSERCESFLHRLGYETELLADAYPNISWHVRHFLARP